MLIKSIGTRVTRGSTLIAAVKAASFMCYTQDLLKNAFLRSQYPSSHHPRFAFIKITKYSFLSLQLFIIKTNDIEIYTKSQ